MYQTIYPNYSMRDIMIKSTLFCLLFFQLCYTQKYETIPVKNSLAIFFKIIPYNRNISFSNLDSINIYFIFDSNNLNSQIEKREVERLIPELIKYGMRGKPIKTYFFDIQTSKYIEKIKDSSSKVIIVIKLKKEAVEKLTKLTHSEKIMSLSTSPKDVSYGISVSCIIFENRPKILFNYAAILNEGLNIHPQILKLAKIINK